MMPKVTVLMPAYNSAEYLPYSIKSILDQTYKDFEFLIIDNASTDNTKEVIDSFNDPRISYRRIEEKGLGNALNYGLKIASNDIIIRMDADDVSLPDRIEKQLNFFLKQKEESVISCGYGVFENNKLKFVVNVNTEHEKLKRRLALHSELINAGLVFNRLTVLNAGGFADHVFEDYELLLRLKDKVTFANINEALMLIRFRKDSYSRKNIMEKNKIVYEIQKPYYEKHLSREFNLKRKKINEIKGWREYFYGNKNKARYYWKKYGLFLIAIPKVLAAFLISFLPQETFIKFREKRWRFRLNYFLNYFSKDNKLLREFLKQSCN
jgi:glycosyltransferase involved in cell wall biosynthesis